MHNLITKPFGRLNGWAKHIGGRLVSDKKISFSTTRVKQLEGKNWQSGMHEKKTAVFGQESSPFDEILKQNGAKEGDIIILDANSGSAPHSLDGFNTKLGNTVKTNFENGSLKIYTPDGALKATIKFDHAKPHLDITRFSPAGSWTGKKTRYKL